MAISKNTGIDFAKMATEMRTIVARWYNAKIQIVDPNTREMNDYWDPETNSYSQATEVVLYTGSARVQPVRNARTPDMSIGQGAVESVRVQVPYDASLGLIREGMRINITDPGEDAVLSGLQLVVRSAINSSYGWNRTIECDVDVKSVADG